MGRKYEDKFTHLLPLKYALFNLTSFLSYPHITKGEKKKF